MKNFNFRWKNLDSHGFLGSKKYSSVIKDDFCVKKCNFVEFQETLGNVIGTANKIASKSAIQFKSIVKSTTEKQCCEKYGRKTNRSHKFVSKSAIQFKSIVKRRVSKGEIRENVSNVAEEVLGKCPAGCCQDFYSKLLKLTVEKLSLLRDNQHFIEDKDKPRSQLLAR